MNRRAMPAASAEAGPSPSVRSSRRVSARRARWRSKPGRRRTAPGFWHRPHTIPPPDTLNRPRESSRPHSAQLRKAGACPRASASCNRKAAIRSLPLTPPSKAARPRCSNRNSRRDGSPSTVALSAASAMAPAASTASSSRRNRGWASTTDAPVMVSRLRPSYSTRSTWVSGSSRAPKRLLVLRTPLATARIFP